MATIQEIAPAPWRMRLVPASFGGVQYHVEQQARSSGRRVVLHEYPKRDVPYAEDMGQHATRYQVTGYLIGPSYHINKAALIDKLNSSVGDTLIDPYLGNRPLKCICERYSVSETRERGGYCTFEMSFVQLGDPGNSIIQEASQAVLRTLAQTTGLTSASNLNINAIASAVATVERLRRALQ